MFAQATSFCAPDKTIGNGLYYLDCMPWEEASLHEISKFAMEYPLHELHPTSFKINIAGSTTPRSLADPQLGQHSPSDRLTCL